MEIFPTFVNGAVSSSAIKIVHTIVIVIDIHVNEQNKWLKPTKLKRVSFFFSF